MNTIKVDDLHLSLHDFRENNFDNTGKHYEIGYFIQNTDKNAGYEFKTIEETNNIIKASDNTDYKDWWNTKIYPNRSNVERLVNSTIRKIKSKNIFLFFLLFIIIGNSSIYYYFERVSYEEFGVFNTVAKCLYHYIGFLFLIKIMQYVFYTFRELYYFSASGDISYVINPFGTSESVVSIVPTPSNKVDKLNDILNKAINNPGITDDTVKGYLSPLSIYSNDVTPPEKIDLSKTIVGVDWTTFIFKVIVIYIICFKLTLNGIPIYGVLYYYNPFACFNMTGFYELINPIWKLSDEDCAKIREIKAERDGTDPTDTPPDDNNPRFNSFKEILLKENSRIFGTFVGEHAHLVFDAFQLRNIRVHKNINPINVFIQMLYIYNSAIFFLNPVTILVLLLGLGYVPATPAHFINGSSTIDAMRKRIILPFYKKWMFYIAQGRCFHTNVFYGVIRRFCTLGSDVWTTDSIFNSDVSKLVCNSRKYYIYVFIISICLMIINTTSFINFIPNPTSSSLLALTITSLVISMAVLFRMRHIYTKEKKTDYYKIFNDTFNDKFEMKGTTQIQEYIEKYKNINTIYDFIKETLNPVKEDMGLLLHPSAGGIEFAISIFIIILLCASNLPPLSRGLLITGIIILFFTSNKTHRDDMAGIKKALNIVLHQDSKSKSNLKETLISLINNLRNSKKSHKNKLSETLHDLIRELKTKGQYNEQNSLESVLKELIKKLKMDTTHASNSGEHHPGEHHPELLETLDNLIHALRTPSDSSKSSPELDKVLQTLIIKLRTHNITKLLEQENEEWDIKTPLNNSTNLFITLLLNKVNEWSTSFHDLIEALRHIIGIQLIIRPIVETMKKFIQLIKKIYYYFVTKSPEEPVNPESPEEPTTPVTPNPVKTKQELIQFESPSGNYIQNSTSTDGQVKSERIKGQKYNDWTQFFTGGSEYEDKSIFLTQFKQTTTGIQGEVWNRLSSKFENPNTKTAKNSNLIGIISVDGRDIDTLIKGQEKEPTSSDLCKELYKNKPRCLTVTKFYRKVETNSSSKMILELEITNGCTGGNKAGVNIDGSLYTYTKVNSDSNQTPGNGTHNPSKAITGGSSNKNAFNYRPELRNTGQEYFVPVEYLDYTKNIKYKINDIKIDPVHGRIKIFGLDKTLDYSPEKIQEVVGTYLEEQNVEELVSQRLEQKQNMKDQMSYTDYMNHKESNHINDKLSTETAQRYMASGGSSDFKERFREKFKETVHGQNIIETLLRENKKKIQPNKYDNIMQMGGNNIIIKSGEKERYITNAGELLPIKKVDTSKDYVDVVTLNDTPMKINVKGKECYMTQDGGLINVRENKNIYKRKKTFKKKRR
jgi:hypothetical protein